MAKTPKGFMTLQDSSKQRTRYAIQVNKGDLERKKVIEERAKEVGASFDFNKVLEDTFIDLLDCAESAIAELGEPEQNNSTEPEPEKGNQQDGQGNQQNQPSSSFNSQQ